jgi:ribonuclease R
MKKSRKNKEKELKQIAKEEILALINSGKSKPMSIRQLARKLGLRDNKTRNELAASLDGLFKSGKIEQLKNGTYRSVKEVSYATGRVDHVNPKFAYIVSEELEDDVWVSQKDLHYAMDGDIVKVAIHKSAIYGRKPEGEVVEIVERPKKEFVGKIELSTRFAFVIPDNRKMYYDIFIPNDEVNHAKNGEKVIVEITEWPGKDKNPVGRIKEVLGAAGDNDVEMHSIMAEFGLPTKFPEKVEKFANKIETEITQEEIKKRRDFRDITTFTIDPIDAKDFDDALSIRKLEKTTDSGETIWEIGVHIADVTHYVVPGTILEKEASNRATSVYLVDRVVPMLPEKLSNELCSLRPNEEKLTFSAVFEMTEKGKLLDEWFGKTIIYSDRRFHYDEAQEIIETGEGDYVSELRTLNNIALKLRKERFKKGAIGFETVEVRFKLDEKGKPLGVIPKVRKDAHKLIEEFMLLANKRVAEFVYGMKKGKNKNTMVYRTHDYPDADKLKAFSVFAKKFGHNINPDEEKISDALNRLVDDIEGKPEQNVLQSLAIRTMAKAIYTTEPEIHFGLAFKHYTHFTSPIRRYPDMMAHRLLQHYLEGGQSADKDYYEDQCEHSSEMERKAAEAERASIKYKQAEYMLNAEDKDFAGIVSGVTEWGVFVEIVETKCEGMVRMADLDDDYYEFDADNYRIIGKRNKKMITLGDDVKVRVKQINLEKRTIDLWLVGMKNEERKKKKKEKEDLTF